MLSLNFSTNKKVFLLFLILVIILILIASIFLINSRSNNLSSPSSINSGLNSLVVEIDQKITAEDKKTSQYQKAKNLLREAGIANDPKEKYGALKHATESLQLLYSTTHNNVLYFIINDDIVNFVKKNFPDLYDERYFSYPCQDPKCAEDSQPPEILSIIEDIKNSDFEKLYKEEYSNNLLNTGYIPESENTRFTIYMITVRSLINQPDLSPSGANITISNKIRDFLKTQYPIEYTELEKFEKEIKIENQDENLE